MPAVESESLETLNLRAGRRRLLKMAAAAAPLVATIPCGAARASGSAAQCLIDAIDNSEAGLVDPVQSVPAPPGDTYVRVQGKRIIFARNDETVFPPVIDEVVAFQVPGYPSGTYFRADGTVFDPNENPSNPYTQQSSADVGLLKVFQPDSRTDPTTVGDCVPGGNDSASTCLYPVSQIDSNNIGVQASCLLSVTA